MRYNWHTTTYIDFRCSAKRVLTVWDIHPGVCTAPSKRTFPLPPRVSLCPFPHDSTSLLSTFWSLSLSVHIFYSLTPYKWNHTVCLHLCLSSFAWYNVFFCHVVAWVSSLVLFSAEQYFISWICHNYPLSYQWTLRLFNSFDYYE